ncbi:MAG: SUMF1/EgtB/PvdO family nonheme iron enzyme, partial [Chthoniobacterales bacterium]
SGADANRNPDAGGEIDGYPRWSPVDAMSKDRSPYDVMGMGGNVSEWTATYAESPDLLGDKVPVIRGGNWSNSDVDTRRRLLKLMPLQQDLSLGFRTVSDTRPSTPPKP